MRVAGEALAQLFHGRTTKDVRNGLLFFEKLGSWSRNGGKLVQ
jgi:hypothetical protein